MRYFGCGMRGTVSGHSYKGDVRVWYLMSAMSAMSVG